MKKQYKDSKLSFYDYSSDGLILLDKKPLFLSYGLIYVICILLFSALIWSFFTRLDVVVTVNGQLRPTGEATKIYSPADGELVDLFVTEGVPVVRDQVIARIKSPSAIRAVAEAEQTRIAFEQAALVRQQFPQHKSLLEKEIKNIDDEISVLQNEYAALNVMGRDRLTASQKHRISLVKSKVDVNRREKESAEDIFRKYKSLREGPGGGGISDQMLQEKRDELFRTQQIYQRALTEYEELEQQFHEQKIGLQKQLAALNKEIIQLKLQRSRKYQDMSLQEEEIETQYQSYLSKWQAAQMMRFSDVDRDNFVEVRASVAGEVVLTNYSQAGEKINATLPIVEISPSSAQKVLVLDIPDYDRGLLNVGQSVTVKFHAFPYHRFGVISGELEHVSSSALVTEDKLAFYKGYVSLDRDYVENNSGKIPLRYGMTALAEVTIQKKRVIDFIVEPFRKAAGS